VRPGPKLSPRRACRSLVRQASCKLEYIQLIGHSRGEISDTFGESSKRWRGIFDIVRNLPNLRGFAPFEWSPDEVAEWPAEQRALLDTIELQIDNAYEPEDFITLLELLPSLKRVRWVTGGLETAGLTRVAHAIHQHGVLESLYIVADSCEIDDFSPLGKLASQLKELAFNADSCELSTPGEHGIEPEEDTFARLRMAISEMLPSTTVNLFTCYESGGWPDEEGGLSRHFLPDLLESWQRQALGPLHNSTQPSVLRSLRDDQRVNSLMAAMARQSLVSGADDLSLAWQSLSPTADDGNNYFCNLAIGETLREGVDDDGTAEGSKEEEAEWIRQAAEQDLCYECGDWIGAVALDLPYSVVGSSWKQLAHQVHFCLGCFEDVCTKRGISQAVGVEYKPTSPLPPSARRERGWPT